MKIELAGVEVEKNIEGQHHQMGIKNPRVIVDFMVNRLYTDKIKAITQEISCNARDAHREAGIPDQPIEITLPSSFTPYFMVKDFGIGMNLERLTNVYKFIGESTKRNDDGQTGGFGIGAKCPWAYSDVFTTETVAWENGKKYKRVLVLHRTPENDISFDVISCEETNEPTGTLVKVPVKEQDYQQFFSQTMRATQLWNIRPIIKGHEAAWNEIKNYLSGKNWVIITKSTFDEHYIINCDGVPYPINYKKLEEIDSSIMLTLRKVFNYSDKALIINANIGEVNVALNRESLEYTPKTCEHIKAHVQNCVENLKAFALQDIASKKSLVGAINCYHKHYSVLESLIPDVLDWTSPNGDIIKINPSSYIHIKGTVFSYCLNWKGRLKRSRNSTLHFKDKILICRNAIANKPDDEPARSQILGMLDALNLGNGSTPVQVITSYDIADANTVNILKQNTLDIVENYPKRKNKPKNTGGGSTNKVVNYALCWEIDSSVITPLYASDYEWKGLAGVAYVLKETAREFRPTKEHTSYMDRYYTYHLAKRLGYDRVVAIREKDEEIAVKNGLVNLYTEILKKTNNNIQTVLCDEDVAFLNTRKILSFIPTINSKIFCKQIFKNEKHLVHKFVKMVHEATEIKNNSQNDKVDYSRYLLPVDKQKADKIAARSKTLSFGLNTIYRKLVKQYPMLLINSKIFRPQNSDYYTKITEAVMCQAVQYINMVDKMNKKQIGD